MFTGIIEEVGTIRELQLKQDSATITVAAKRISSSLKIGESIAVNGVCLTATHIGEDSFTCDISAETLERSSFRKAKQGAEINLERSLMLSDRLGGHFVLGHVDGVGRLASRIPSGKGAEMFFEYPSDLERYMVYKGSIAVNGISLTIASLGNGSFSVAAIPHTLNWTNLNQLTIGDPVNLEVDILGKYFERFFQLGLMQNRKKDSKLTSEYLKGQGF